MRSCGSCRIFGLGQAKGDADADIQFLGDRTQAAADAFHTVREKVSDYFTRCQTAAYDIRAAVPLSRSTEDYEGIRGTNVIVKNTDIASFPLATVEPDKPLPLVSGLNPAWQKQIDALRERTRCAGIRR